MSSNHNHKPSCCRAHSAPSGHSAKALAACLVELELETIDLSNNGLSAASALHIAGCLADGQESLRSLNLGANAIGGDVKVAIQGKFRRRGSVFSLHLGY